MTRLGPATTLSCFSRLRHQVANSSVDHGLSVGWGLLLIFLFAFCVHKIQEWQGGFLISRSPPPLSSSFPLLLLEVLGIKPAQENEANSNIQNQTGFLNL